MKSMGNYCVKIALPLVVLLTLLNFLMIASFHRNTSKTTLIFSEVFKKSEGTSASDTETDNVAKLRNRVFDTDRKEEDFISKEANEQDEDKPEDIVDEADDNEKDKGMKDEMIDEMIRKLSGYIDSFIPKDFWHTSYMNLSRTLGAKAKKSARTLPGYKTRSPRNSSMANWRQFHRNIRQFSLYDPDDPVVDALLHDLATLPIIEAEENDGGTELKVNIRFSDEGRAILKPMRYARDVETNPNSYIFDDIERHIAEIAAFQLDRLLGFYRVPPTVGRKLNMTSEIEMLVPDSIKKTFYTSPAGNRCFYGECDYYCDSAHAFCGNPDIIEASIMSYLPSRTIAPRKSWYQPWRRSYSKFRKAYWEKHDDMCNRIRKEYPYNNGKLLFDMIDTHTFDFLTGNKDRHSFVTFKEYGNFSFPILYDNGRGFGRKTYDAMSILAPLRQCCLIRKSTFLKYVKLYTGPDHLSQLMKQALANDPVAPVLIDGHLEALDRRLVKILKEIAICTQKHPVHQVIYSDKF